MKVCKKHKKLPEIIYNNCIGCELVMLRKQIDVYKEALEKIKSAKYFSPSVIATYALEDVKLK